MTLVDLICHLDPTEANALRLILEELYRAKEKWPDWVNDPIHAAGVLVEEAGETMQAALDLTYSDGTVDHVGEESAQAGAMAIRLIANLSRTKPHKHFQGTTMSNPDKPCDVDEYRDRLPCCNPAGTECWGEVAWDKARGAKPKKLKYIGECKHIERVREWWARNNRGGK